MKNFLQKIKQFATGKTVLILFIATMAVYLWMLLVTIPQVQAYAPGKALFDLSPTGYSYQEAVSLLETLGEEGRQVYLTRQIPLDFIYPGLFAAAYSLMLAWIFQRGFSEESPIFLLTLIPLAGGLFDYFENIGIILMLTTFPTISSVLVTIASVFTVMKSMSTIIFYFALIFGIIMWVVKAIRQRTTATT